MSYSRSVRPELSMTCGTRSGGSSSLKASNSHRLCGGNAAGTQSALRLIGENTEFVDEPVRLRLCRGEVLVALSIAGDGLDISTAVSCEDFVERSLGLDDLLRLNLDVGRLPSHTAVRLMDHHFRVRKNVPLARMTRREQDGATGVRAADAEGRHFTRDELHRVVDGKGVIHRAPGAIDVKVDVLPLLLILEVEHLHQDSRRGGLIDLADQKDHAILEQQFVDRHLARSLIARRGKDVPLHVRRESVEHADGRLVVVVSHRK